MLQTLKQTVAGRGQGGLHAIGKSQELPNHDWGLQRPEPEGPTHSPAPLPETAATGRPALEPQQRLLGLITASLTTGHQAQLPLLMGCSPLGQPHRQTKGAAIAETNQGLEPPAQHPGLSGQRGQLQAQSKFPAGGVRPG